MRRGGAGPEIAPFYVMEMIKAVEAAQSEGRRVLRLEVGQPSTGAPATVVAAAQAALASGEPLGYTSSLGIRPLRERLADHYRDTYNVVVDADRFVVTVGSSVGFVLAFLAVFAPGARVAVTEPGYPCYRNTLEALGRVPVGIALGADSDHRLTVAMLEQAGPLDGVIVASPANPTGTILGRQALGDIARWCECNDVTLISDEIYHGLSYGAEVTTAAELSPDAIVVNSFSKYFSMTGWRLGWLLLPEDLLGPVERLAQNLVICPTTLAQYAALAAFDAATELDGHIARYRENRAILLDGLPAAGLTRFAPADGAFYVYADVTGLGLGSTELCRRWLAELDVAATPGIDFDPTRGENSVRFSFAGATPDITEAVARLQRWQR